MPDLRFRILGAEVVPFAAVPTVGFRLEVANTIASEAVHSAVLRAQIQIDATRRRYNEDEQARLRDLFGTPDRWSTTLRAMLWTHVTIPLTQFTGITVVEVAVPCTFDFNVAATKYFQGLTQGEVPLTFLFSGTVFYETGDERTLLVAPVPWDKEATAVLSVATWQQMMDHYYPDGAWLRLRRDTFERLADYKRRSGIPTWEDAIERLLPLNEPVVRLMPADPLEVIARTVLYEGYLLYPYRASALKNRQRFNFGVLFPASYCQAIGSDRSDLQVECPFESGAATTISLSVRFLQLVERAAEPDRAGTWHEAIERRVDAGPLALSALLATGVQVPFSFAAIAERTDADCRLTAPGDVAAPPAAPGDGSSGTSPTAVVCGELQATARAAGEGRHILTVRVANHTPFAATAARDQALSAALASAHVVIRIAGGALVSLLDPPERCRDAAAACVNLGVFPVMVGAPGSCDCMLASPITLYDYPEIAPESAGDLFDGTEIDEILALRILTLTAEEKREARASDERARQILDRTEGLAPEHWARLHGAVRGLRKVTGGTA